MAAKRSLLSFVVMNSDGRRSSVWKFFANSKKTDIYFCPDTLLRKRFKISLHSSGVCQFSIPEEMRANNSYPRWKLAAPIEEGKTHKVCVLVFLDSDLGSFSEALPQDVEIITMPNDCDAVVMLLTLAKQGTNVGLPTEVHLLKTLSIELTNGQYLWLVVCAYPKLLDTVDYTNTRSKLLSATKAMGSSVGSFRSLGINIDDGIAILTEFKIDITHLEPRDSSLKAE